MYTKTSFNTGIFLFSFTSSSAFNSEVNIDNIKIWKEILTQNPSWLYNGSNGREEALHTIYDPLNNYELGNVQVGYFYR